MTVLRLLESVHGHFGVLAVAILVHPALLLRKGHALSRRARFAVGACALFALAAFATGLVIYEDYRSGVRAGLFQASAAAGLLFETKEHLAFAVVAMALSGAVAALVAPREARALRQAAGALFAASALLCAITVALGTYVAAVHGFG